MGQSVRAGKKSQVMVAHKNDLIDHFFTSRTMCVGEAVVSFTLCLMITFPKWLEVFRK